MCCQFHFSAGLEENIRRMVMGVSPVSSFEERNIHPCDSAVVIAQNSEGLIAESFKWGFLLNPNNLIINARSESVFEKKSFSECIKSRRCIIPASSFFEWDSRKQKVEFSLPDNLPLYMAGIYNSAGEFTVLTKEANDSVSRFHNRMPVIIAAENAEDWIRNEKAARPLIEERSPQLHSFMEFEQFSLF